MTLSLRTRNMLAAFNLKTKDEICKIFGHGLAKRPPNLGKKSQLEIKDWLNHMERSCRV